MDSVNTQINQTNPKIDYGHQWIDEADIRAVADVLRSDWLTTGPKVSEFEQAVADYVGAEYAVAVNSGTAALHAAVYAVGVGPGDEVILPPMTFVATANCVVYQGATPVFADVEPDTLLINPVEVESKITERTKAIIAVDYAGQPCDYNALRKIAKRHDLVLIADACHSIGAQFNGKNVGTLADLSVFSFHPVKHITTGEGGMIVTDEDRFAERMRRFRNHGISMDSRQRADHGTWYYEMVDLGYNYRITDFQCALGISQLRNLPAFLEKRRQIAAQYNKFFSRLQEVEPLGLRDGVLHAYHLYVVKTKYPILSLGRAEFFRKMREKDVNVNVHYIPVHIQPFYRKHFNTHPGLCSVAETAYEGILSLPIFPAMKTAEVQRVIMATNDTVAEMRKETTFR
ncbi:MAG: UDP-4-amino-4,6-dideoxy-N-acetyl-beta-L-altrosamine transaminase [Desulfobacterales bacterium]|jgi:perosamine synthetase